MNMCSNSNSFQDTACVLSSPTFVGFAEEVYSPQGLGDEEQKNKPLIILKTTLDTCILENFHRF